MPPTVLSKRTWQISITPLGRLSRSTTKPWFWLVISPCRCPTPLRMIGPPMTMVHFRGGGPERQCQHLVAQTYTKNRFATLYQGLDCRHRVGTGGRRSPGPFEKYAVWVVGQDIICARRCRHDGHFASRCREAAQDIALGSEPATTWYSGSETAIVALSDCPCRLRPRASLSAGDFLGEVRGSKVRPGFCRGA